MYGSPPKGRNVVITLFLSDQLLQMSVTNPYSRHSQTMAYSSWLVLLPHTLLSLSLSVGVMMMREEVRGSDIGPGGTAPVIPADITSSSTVSTYI